MKKNSCESSQKNKQLLPQKREDAHYGLVGMVAGEIGEEHNVL